MEVVAKKMIDPAGQLIAHFAEGIQIFRIGKAPMGGVRSRENRTAFGRGIANRNHPIKAFLSIFGKILGLLMRNIDTNFAHNLSGYGIQTFGTYSRAKGLECTTVSGS